MYHFPLYYVYLFHYYYSFKYLNYYILFTLLLLTDNSLSRIEGAFLSLFYIGYLLYLVLNRNKIRAEEGELVENIRGGLSWSSTAASIMISVGLSMAIYASNNLIDSVNLSP